MAVQPYFDRETVREIPISDAAERTLVAAERLARDWVQLARLEVTTALKTGAIKAALLATAGVLAIFAWVGASIALGMVLARWLPGDASAAIVAGANLAVAAALALTARRGAEADPT
jgi:hypothetical protein